MPALFEALRKFFFNPWRQGLGHSVLTDTSPKRRCSEQVPAFAPILALCSPSQECKLASLLGCAKDCTHAPEHTHEACAQTPTPESETQQRNPPTFALTALQLQVSLANEVGTARELPRVLDWANGQSRAQGLAHPRMTSIVILATGLQV